MVWTFHVRASKPNRPNQVCQECLLESRARGEKRAPRGARLPCETHGMPELWEDNVEAWSLYEMVKLQIILFDQTDVRGKPKPPLIELNHAAVLPVLALYVPKKRRQECFQKLLLIHEIMQSQGVADFFIKRGYSPKTTP